MINRLIEWSLRNRFLVFDRQNDKLERWHLERLLLLFKGFECLNGAHSPLHREAFEPVLNRVRV